MRKALPGAGISVHTRCGGVACADGALEIITGGPETARYYFAGLPACTDALGLVAGARLNCVHTSDRR